MSCSSSFQCRGSDTEKRWSPKVVSVRGTDNESSRYVCRVRRLMTLMITMWCVFSFRDFSMAAASTCTVSSNIQFLQEMNSSSCWHSEVVQFCIGNQLWTSSASRRLACHTTPTWPRCWPIARTLWCRPNSGRLRWTPGGACVEFQHRGLWLQLLSSNCWTHFHSRRAVGVARFCVSLVHTFHRVIDLKLQLTVLHNQPNHALFSPIHEYAHCSHWQTDKWQSQRQTKFRMF